MICDDFFQNMRLISVLVLTEYQLGLAVLLHSQLLTRVTSLILMIESWVPAGAELKGRAVGGVEPPPPSTW